MAYEIIDSGKTIIWTVGSDKIGAQLVYNVYEDGSLKETRTETCLAPRDQRSITPPYSSYDYVEVPSGGETLVDRPKAAVTVTAADPAAIVGDWTTRIYDYNANVEVTTGASNKTIWLLVNDAYPCASSNDCWGSFSVKVDEAKWIPDPVSIFNLAQSDPWLNTAWSRYDGGRYFNVVVTYILTQDTYPAGTVLPKTYNIPFRKTREVVSVSAGNIGGTVTKSNPLPSVPGVSTMSLEGLPEGYEWGSTVTITATPDPGYRFDHWEYLGTDTDPHNIDGSTNSTETFEALPRVYSSATGLYDAVESYYQAIFVPVTGTPHLLCSKSSPHQLLCSGTSSQLLWGNVLEA